jgi:hypothetical protein
MQPILALVSRGPRPNPMPSGRSGASVSGGRGRGGRGRVMVGDAQAIIRQNDMRRQFRDAIEIACDVYRESTYWGRREGFLRRSSNSVLGPQPSSSGSRGVRASSSSASTSFTSSQGRRGAGPQGPFRGERRRPDMHRR